MLDYLLPLIFLACAVYGFLEWSVERMKDSFNSVMLLVLFVMLGWSGVIANDWHRKHEAETAELRARADDIELDFKSARRDVKKMLAIAKWAADKVAEQQGGEVPELEHK